MGAGDSLHGIYEPFNKNGETLNCNGKVEDEGVVEEEDWPQPMDVDSLLECGDALHSSENLVHNDKNACNFITVLKKLIDLGKVHVAEVASEIGMPPDSLKSELIDNHVVSKLCIINRSFFLMLKLSPGDELEGEVMYYQQKLLSNALARRHISDNLILKVVKNLPLEMDLQGQRKWDDILVTQYNHELREARKQRKRERKHKEALAILAAATAAAASSSRVSYIRKYTSEEYPNQKADTQKHGVEEFKSPKQVRVELERLRLLCERIVRREKLKSEIIHSSREILASKRDSLLLSSSRHPYYQKDISSESTTTSDRC